MRSLILLLVAAPLAVAAPAKSDFNKRFEKQTVALFQALKSLRAESMEACKAIEAKLPAAGRPKRTKIAKAPLPAKLDDPLVLHIAAVAMEKEACQRYAELLLMDTVGRGGNASDAPGYLCPEREEFSEKKKRGKKVKKGKKRKVAPVLDDFLDTSMDDVGPAAEAPPPDAAKLPGAEDRLADVGAMRCHVERLVAIVKAWDSSREAPAPNRFGAVGDSHFGPWWTFRALPTKNGANHVAADAGGKGTKEWRHVDGWRIFGPQPPGAPARKAAALPHRLLLEGATYAAKALPGTRKEPVPMGSSWKPFPVGTSTGMLRPPIWGKQGSYGGLACGTSIESCWYAVSHIICDAEKELWFAAGTTVDACLWINDVLVAAWPVEGAKRDMENPILFRQKLVKGINEVLFRVRHMKMSGGKGPPLSGAWLKVCTRGAPLDAAAAKARDEKIAARTATLKPFPDTVRGWRGNWLGVEPEAKPVTAWDIERNINVRWRSGLPWTISTPVVSGNYLVTTAEPFFVACLEKKTGKLLWRQPVDVLEICAPEVSKQVRGSMEEYFDLYHAIFTTAQDADNERQEPITVNGAEITPPAAWQKCREHTKTFYRAVGKPLEAAGHRVKYLWMNYMGPICATPVTDGKHVWAWTSFGGAACFDLATGDRKWLVELPHQCSAYGAFSSPVLVDEKLILEVVPDDKKRPGGKSKGGEHREVYMLALDAATGKELWRSHVQEPISSASPIATRITDGKQDMTVLITGGCGTRKYHGEVLRPCFLGGTVVRADDGKVLIEDLALSCGYGTPVAVGDIVYHCGKGQMTATRLVMRDRDTLGAIRLWTQYERRGFEPCVSPYKGYLYADLAGGPGGQGDAGYAVYDAATGKEVRRRVNLGWPLSLLRSGWGGSGRKYSMTALAGGFVYCGDSGEAFGGKKLKYATFTTLEAKPQGRMLARNHLPPRSNSTLVFDGDNMYYRNTFGVICLGYTGDEGKAYEAVQNAKFVIDDLNPERPGTGKAIPVAALPRAPNAAHLRPLHDRPRPSFYTTEPMAGGLGPKLAALCAQPAFMDAGRGAYGRSSLSLTLDGEAVVFNEYAFSKHSWPKHPKRGGRVKGNAAGPKGFGTKLVLSAENPSQYYAVLMRCGNDRCVRFVSETKNPNVKAWLGGVPLKHQGRYRLAKGVYALVAEITAPDGDVSANDLCLDFRLVPAADDAAVDVAVWQADLKSVKPYLDRVVALAPETDEAKRARAFLSLIK